MINELPKEQVTLVTQRLNLRALKMEDADSIVAIHSDKDMAKLMSESIPFPYSREDAVTFIENAYKNYRECENIEFGVTLKDEDELIGVVGIDINQKDDHVTLGYWLGKAWWGDGYMSEAVSEAVRYCFEDLTIHRVASHHFHPNIASGRVMQKAGLKYEGRRKEHYKKGDIFFDIIDYGVVKNEWETL